MPKFSFEFDAKKFVPRQKGSLLAAAWYVLDPIDPTSTNAPVAIGVTLLESTFPFVTEPK